MKVALVGASGFIGTRILEKSILGGGPDLVAVVRRPASLALPARFALESHVADGLDIDGMARAFSGCQAVIHAAQGDPEQVERMPVALCLAAASAGVPRLIYLSSASVHGQNPTVGTDEAAELNPDQPFEPNRAKIRAELKFFAECQRHGLTGFALRPGIVYGPRSHWIADLASDLIDGRAWLYEGGRGICNAIYVDNLVAAINGCLHTTDDSAGVFLVGDEEKITWEQFYRAAALKLDVPFSTIQQLNRLPDFKRSWTDRAGAAAAHPLVQRLLPLIPHGLKRSARAVIEAAAPSPRADSWTLPSTPRPRLTEELALLQQCSWKFPYTRATQHLDYHPAVTFEEGIERSFAWWRFASGEFAFAA